MNGGDGATESGLHVNVGPFSGYRRIVFTDFPMWVLMVWCAG